VTNPPDQDPSRAPATGDPSLTHFIACTAVLFDSDGVLVDSGESVIRAWTKWALHESLDPQIVLPMVHGRRTRDAVALLIDHDGQQTSLDLINRLEVEDVATVTEMPGAVACTRDFPPGTWAVVTSATRTLATARLDAAGITPQVLVTADDVVNGKPAPDGWLRAAELLGVPISNCVVLEDSGAGVAAARAAGVGHVIGVGERADATKADLCVSDLRSVAWAPSGLRVSAASPR
jgi:sugar-phosphatase